MEVKEILEFLDQAKGYRKEGAKRLANKVLKGKASIQNCAIALKIFNQKYNEEENKVSNRLDLGGNSSNQSKNEILKEPRTLIYDIETSYNIVSSWRVGYKINLPHYSILKERAIICVSYKWLGEDEVYTLSWDNNQCDKFLLEQFIEVMNEADVLVAHYGDKFDLKWIKTRALKHGLQMLPNYVTVDTKWLASKHFYLNSNKLDYIAKFLGFEGKINTEPELWDKIILHKDPKAMDDMITYCEEDVRQLEKVYNKLITWDKPKQHAGVLFNNDKISSPISGSKNLELVKTTTTPAGTIKRIMRDLDTNRLFEMSNVNYNKYIANKTKK